MNTPRTFRRPVHAVTLPGGDLVHVRGLTVADLRRVDAAAEAVADPAERAGQTTMHIAALSLAEPDGTPWFPADGGLAEQLDHVAGLLTPDQLEAVCTAAVGRGKDAAKNG